MPFEKKYSDEQKLVAYYLLQNTTPEAAYDFLKAHGQEIAKNSLKFWRSKAANKIIDPAELQEALNTLNISREELDEFLQSKLERESAGSEVKTKPATSTDDEIEEKPPETKPKGGSSGNDVGTEPETEFDIRKIEIVEPEKTEEIVEGGTGGAPEKKQMTPEEFVYTYGFKGLEELKRRRLEKELKFIGASSTTLKRVMHRWENDPEVRREFGALFEMLRRYVPSSFSRDILLDVVKDVWQIEDEYGDLIGHSQPFFVRGRSRNEEVPIFIQDYYHRRHRPRSVEEIGLGYERELGQRGRERYYDRNYDDYDYVPRDYLRYIARRLDELEGRYNGGRTISKSLSDSKIPNQSTREVASNLSTTNGSAAPLTSSPLYHEYERLKSEFANLQKVNESLTKSLQETKNELKELREDKRDRELLDKVNSNIDKRLSDFTSGVNEKIEEVKSLIPERWTVNDQIKFLERKDTRDIEMAKIGLEREREERADKRKEMFGKNLGEFINSLGVKIGNAIAATVTEIGTGEEYEVPIAQSANQPNLAATQCPSCKTNVWFPMNAAQVICPVCGSTFTNPFIAPSEEKKLTTEEIETKKEEQVEEE